MIEIARQYGFSLDYVADALASFGVPPPIDASATLRALVDAEQAFALLEALTSLDAAEVDEQCVESRSRARASLS